MAEASERGYRWGKVQAWVSLVVGAVIFLTGPFAADFSMSVARCVVGVLFLCAFAGLLHKHRYGFVLVYVIAGLVLLTWLAPLLTGNMNVSGTLGGLLFWVVPAVFYYPKRYREFGFRKAPTSVPTSEAPKPGATESAQAAVAGRGGEDAGIRRVSEEEWREAVARHRVKLMQDERNGKPR
jgi:uncharacterized membrane protein YiaA